MAEEKVKEKAKVEEKGKVEETEEEVLDERLVFRLRFGNGPIPLCGMYTRKGGKMLRVENTAFTPFTFEDERRSLSLAQEAFDKKHATNFKREETPYRKWYHKNKPKTIVQNPDTGEYGYWITVKGGKQVFVPQGQKKGMPGRPPKAGPENRNRVREPAAQTGPVEPVTGESDGVMGAIKTGLKVAGAMVLAGAAYQGMTWYMVKSTVPAGYDAFKLTSAKDMKTSFDLLRENAGMLASLNKSPWPWLREAGLGAIPLGVHPVKGTADIGNSIMSYFTMVPVSAEAIKRAVFTPKTGKFSPSRLKNFFERRGGSAGVFGASFNKKEGWFEPLVMLEKEYRGAHLYTQKKVIKDLYVQARQQGFGEMRIRTDEMGAYNWPEWGARAWGSQQGFDVLGSYKKWATQWTKRSGVKKRFTPRQLQSVRTAAKKAKEPWDLTGLKLKDKKGKYVKVGKEAFKDGNVYLYWDLGTDNPSHRFFRKVIGVTEKDSPLVMPGKTPIIHSKQSLNVEKLQRKNMYKGDLKKWGYYDVEDQIDMLAGSLTKEYYKKKGQVALPGLMKKRR